MHRFLLNYFCEIKELVTRNLNKKSGPTACQERTNIMHDIALLGVALLGFSLLSTVATREHMVGQSTYSSRTASSQIGSPRPPKKPWRAFAPLHECRR